MSTCEKEPAATRRPPCTMIFGTGLGNFAPSRSTPEKGLGVIGRSIEEELCVVCGDNASGYHYSALSCEGCKGFFRRTVTRSLTYHCKYEGKCEMDMWMRRKCQACRWRRCLECGMRVDCLLSQAECKEREAKRKAKRKDKCKRGLIPNTCYLPPYKQYFQRLKYQAKDDNDFYPNPLLQTPYEVRSLIESILHYQEIYDKPADKDIEKVLELSNCFQVSNSKEVKELLFTQLAQFTVLSTQLIAEFAKQMSGFSELTIDDQLTILKGCTCENLMLRTARQFEEDADFMLMLADSNSMDLAGLDSLIPAMFSYCESLTNLNVDDVEYGLMTCISLFTERENLKEPRKVEKIQEQYTKALMVYCKARARAGNKRFAKLVMKLTDLKSLTALHIDTVLTLKIKTKGLPVMLDEHFDVEIQST